MATQKRERASKQKRKEEPPAEDTPSASAREKLTKDIDEILDEIEGVLEENQNMAADFIQRGGE